MTSIRGLSTALATLAVTVSAWPGPAAAQPLEAGPTAPPGETSWRAAGRAAGDILAQPIRDAGLLTAEIPDPLVRATIDPYALPDPASCTEIQSEIGDLNGVLGSDLAGDFGPREGRAARLAEAGGRAAVNSLIPFRVVVRELTGAAPAQRRFQAAVDLGYARRGFLRAVYRLRNCEAEPAATGDAPASEVAVR
ncbi:hypothetical protein [Phenylobacterium sp.]|uniref:hypothetical protein n=1 Tax=Phenylobacterium sp. TaxID=1871053 RepID=UPI0025DE877A|nr:hypothetical protein [Phenylobacterium sp.]